MKFFLVTLFFLFNVNCFSQNEIEQFNNANTDILKIKPINVSIIQLISTPEKYNEKTITIKGFFSLEFEGTAIYLNSTDYEQFNSKNGVFVLLSREDSSKLKIECHKKYVSLTGVFKSKYYGQIGRFSGWLIPKRIFINESR